MNRLWANLNECKLLKTLGRRVFVCTACQFAKDLLGNDYFAKQMLQNAEILFKRRKEAKHRTCVDYHHGWRSSDLDRAHPDPPEWEKHRTVSIPPEIPVLSFRPTEPPGRKTAARAQK